MLQAPVAVALVAARIAGVPLLDNQTVSDAPLGARAKYIWPTLVSAPDRTTGEDHVLLVIDPLTASACEVGYVNPAITTGMILKSQWRRLILKIFAI